jgi:hypothetical protein
MLPLFSGNLHCFFIKTDLSLACLRNLNSFMACALDSGQTRVSCHVVGVGHGHG